jgi:hypothetical protein
MTTLSITLSNRDRAILRAVARGDAELVVGVEPVLYLDGLACSDQFAVCRLVRDGLIRGAQSVALDCRVAARLTSAGAAGLGPDPVSVLPVRSTPAPEAATGVERPLRPPTDMIAA